jgi:hypothetical protein
VVLRSYDMERRIQTQLPRIAMGAETKSRLCLADLEDGFGKIFVKPEMVRHTQSWLAASLHRYLRLLEDLHPTNYHALKDPYVLVAYPGMPH